MKTNKINFNGYEELAQYILDDMNYFYEDETNQVSVIADGWECAEILVNLFSVAYAYDENIFIEDLEIQTHDCDIPFLITVNEDGGVWCEPATTSEGKMLWMDSPIVYAPKEYVLHADHNLAENHIIYEYTIGEEESDEVDECDNDNNHFIPIVDEEDDTIHGFEINLEEDGKCFHGMYCSCEPMIDREDLDNLVKVYNDIVTVFLSSL